MTHRQRSSKPTTSGEAKTHASGQALGSVTLVTLAGSLFVSATSLAQVATPDAMIVEGKTIDLGGLSQGSNELNKALQKPGNFQQFARDPADFAQQHGLQISPELSELIRDRLHGVTSLEEAEALTARQQQEQARDFATVAAVASAAVAVTTSKIAVAF